MKTIRASKLKRGHIIEGKRGAKFKVSEVVKIWANPTNAVKITMRRIDKQAPVETIFVKLTDKLTIESP